MPEDFPADRYGYVGASSLPNFLTLVLYRIALTSEMLYMLRLFFLILVLVIFASVLRRFNILEGKAIPFFVPLALLWPYVLDNVAFPVTQEIWVILGGAACFFLIGTSSRVKNNVAFIIYLAGLCGIVLLVGRTFVLLIPGLIVFSLAIYRNQKTVFNFRNLSVVCLLIFSGLYIALSSFFGSFSRTVLSGANANKGSLSIPILLLIFSTLIYCVWLILLRRKYKSPTLLLFVPLALALTSVMTFSVFGWAQNYYTSIGALGFASTIAIPLSFLSNLPGRAMEVGITLLATFWVFVRLDGYFVAFGSLGDLIRSDILGEVNKQSVPIYIWRDQQRDAMSYWLEREGGTLMKFKSFEDDPSPTPPFMVIWDGRLAPLHTPEDVTVLWRGKEGASRTGNSFKIGRVTGKAD